MFINDILIPRRKQRLFLMITGSTGKKPVLATARYLHGNEYFWLMSKVIELLTKSPAVLYRIIFTLL